MQEGTQPAAASFADLKAGGQGADSAENEEETKGPYPAGIENAKNSQAEALALYSLFAMADGDIPDYS